MKRMQSDFLDAHERHWKDAEMLWKNQRLANADHLYGMSVECGLKRLMQAFGMPLTPVGNPSERADRVHADGTWQRYESYRSGRCQGAAYALPPQNPFDDWHISQRYAHQNQFHRYRVQRHRNGAETVRGLIDRARKDGLL